MENKEIIDALTQIPALIKAADTYKETSSHIIATLAEAVKQRPQAVVPESELMKLKQVISTTRCALPDVNHVSRELARKFSNEAASAMGPIIMEKAAEALKGASVTVNHVHCIEKDLKDVVDKKMKKTISILAIIIASLVETIIISAISYYYSDTYWGKRYYELYTSPYLTSEEKANLERNAGYTGILPLNYHDDPTAARLQLQQKERILKQREKEARKNNH